MGLEFQVRDNKFNVAASSGSTEFLWGVSCQGICNACGTKYLPENSEYCMNCGKKFE